MSRHRCKRVGDRVGSVCVCGGGGGGGTGVLVNHQGTCIYNFQALPGREVVYQKTSPVGWPMTGVDGGSVFQLMLWVDES